MSPLILAAAVLVACVLGFAWFTNAILTPQVGLTLLVVTLLGLGGVYAYDSLVDAPTLLAIPCALLWLLLATLGGVVLRRLWRSDCGGALLRGASTWLTNASHLRRS